MDAFAEVYKRYAGDVYRFALWLCGRPEVAEEVVAETFVRVWTRWQRVRTDTVKGYLLAIARNVVRDHYRRRRPVEPLDVRHPDPGPTPHDRAEHRSELEAVMAALDGLSMIDREVLVLRVVHELPYAEIARVLQISISAAKVKVHRTRIKLAARRLGGNQA